MRLVLILPALLLFLAARPAHDPERWQNLPNTPPPLVGEHTGVAKVNGIDLFYAEIGAGPPVLLLHGGLANSDYMGNQARALAPHHRVILMDSRGHGRSTRDSTPFSYDLMTDDAVALLDTLGIAKTDIVGWSDGAIIGLDMAMRYPDRVGRIFAFGVNTEVAGLKAIQGRNAVMMTSGKRDRADYRRLSLTPGDYQDFVAQLGAMWESQPNWTAAQLRSIHTPVMIVDGDHDEAIKASHTAYIAATIPGAQLLILPEVSHFAFLQDPTTFNAAMLRFLDQ